MAFDPYGGYQAPGGNTLPSNVLGSPAGNLAGSSGLAGVAPAPSFSATQGGGASGSKGTSISGITPAAAPMPAPASAAGSGSWGPVNNANANPYIPALQQALASGATIGSIGNSQYQGASANESGNYQGAIGQNTPNKFGIMTNGKQVDALSGATIAPVQGKPGTFQMTFADPGSEGTVVVTLVLSLV